MNPVIAIPAFQRAHSLERLLNSIDEANRRSDSELKLLVSLEGGSSMDVRKVADQFAARTDLDVKVVQQPDRLGLRKHILWCGDLSKTYGAVVVLEDDLIVDPHFFGYASKALEFYESDPKVAGIALYAPQYNEFAMLPFRPLFNGFSAYPMQTACSWGQCWSANQWSRFRSWYDKATDQRVKQNLYLPARVKGWSENSWKKYFACFLVETGTSFIYPYEGYSSNCGDEGGFHNHHGSSIHQVEMGFSGRPAPTLSFSRLEDSTVRYDSFMEQCGEEVLRRMGLGISTLDLYGLKPLQLLQNEQAVATCRPMKNWHASFPLRFRPIEQNLYFPCEDHNCGPIHLGKGSEIEDSRGVPMDFESLSYFAGFNLAFRAPLTAITRNLAGTWFSHFRRKLASYWP